MPRLKIIVALGAMTHQALLLDLRAQSQGISLWSQRQPPLPDGRLLVDSYHCSGYNWRTGRLSRESFEAVFAGVSASLG